MLGLPEEFVDSIHKGAGADSQFLGVVSPTLIGLKKLEEPPKDIRITKNLRFIGKLPPNLSLKSIVGMSGGPIFGFNYGPPMRYWIVAIQSTWLKSRGITFGCPVPVLAELISGWSDQLIKEGEFVSIKENQDNNQKCNNTMHSDGQGHGVLYFYSVWCLIAIYNSPSTLPTGDGRHYL